MSDCAQCCNRLHPPKRDEAFYRMETPLFCSAACFRAYVEGMSPSGISPSIVDHVRLVRPDERGGDPPCYSPLLHTSFRSGFECMFTETIHLEWHWKYFYEPHVVRIDEKHVYLPDYYLPRFGVWIEVKGEWRIGSKKKFLVAQDLLGRDRLLLIPPTYRNWFGRHGGRLKCVI